MIKKLLKWLLGVMIIWGYPANNVWAAPASPAYQSCLLKYVKPAKSEIAALHLQKVCARRALADKESTANTIPKNKTLNIDIQSENEEDYVRYDGCLLQHLPPVQNDQSAQWMVQFCQDQFAPIQPHQEPKQAKQGNLLEFLQRIDSSHSPKSPSTSAPLLQGDTFVPLSPAKVSIAAHSVPPSVHPVCTTHVHP